MKRRWLIVFFVLAALYAGYRLTLRWMVEVRLNAVRKQGYPVTLAELEKWYPKPLPKENAANLYIEAFARYIGVTNYSAKHDKPKLRLFTASDELLFDGRLPTQAEIDAISAYITDNRATDDLLHKASTIRQCRYPVHEPPDDHQLAQYLSGVRGGIHLLLLEAIGAATRGNAAQSCDSIVSALALARSLSAEPLLDDGMFRTQQQTLCFRVLQSVFQRVTFDDTQLAALASALVGSEDSQALRRAFVSERIGVREEVKLPPLLEPIRKLWDKGSSGIGWAIMGELQLLAFRLSAREELDTLTYLNTLQTAIEAADEPWPDRLAVSKAVRTQDRRLAVHPYREFTAEVDARNAAELRTAATAVSAELARLTRAGLLDKLPEPVTADPFTGQPLRYKKLAKGYVVYSVGEDGVDDGGDEKKDIPFTVER